MRKFLESKFSTVLLSGLLIVVLVVAARVWIQKYQVDRQISRLQDRVNDIQGQNSQLADLVKYLDTPEYKEQQAREKLNLKKEGEVVVALPQAKESNSEVSGSSVETAPISNPQKWYSYLFKHTN